MPAFTLETFEQTIKEGDLYNAQMRAKSALFRIHRKKQFPQEAKMLFGILKILETNYSSEMDSMIMEIFSLAFKNVPAMIARALANVNKAVILSLLNKIKYCKEKVSFGVGILCFKGLCGGCDD